jgi:hypothetical protein
MHTADHVPARSSRWIAGLWTNDAGQAERASPLLVFAPSDEDEAEDEDEEGAEDDEELEADVLESLPLSLSSDGRDDPPLPRDGLA